MFQLHAELRSITSICVVEDISKCPLGYTPIVRTHDQESDADLWKDGFFGRRVTRYVCVSKSQGRPEHVIQAIQILHEKELPPEGFSVIQQTTDTSQKAFKKKQLCFKHTHFRVNVESIVDVIILSKIKNPPDGYDHIGDINGMHFFVRKVSALTRLSMPTPGLAYGALPGGPPVYPSLPDSMNNLNLNSNVVNAPLLPTERFSNSSAPNSPAHTVISSPGYPNQNLVRSNSCNTGTLSHLTGLEGVPLILRDDLRSSSGIGGIMNGRGRIHPTISIKNASDIEKEYNYDFRAERETINGI